MAVFFASALSILLVITFSMAVFGFHIEIVFTIAILIVQRYYVFAKLPNYIQKKIIKSPKKLTEKFGDIKTLVILKSIENIPTHPGSTLLDTAVDKKMRLLITSNLIPCYNQNTYYLFFFYFFISFRDNSYKFLVSAVCATDI